MADFSPIVVHQGRMTPAEASEVPPWVGGFCSTPGVYETLRFPPGGGEESAKNQMELHYRRLIQSLKWSGLDVDPGSLSPRDHWMEWSWRACQLARGTGGLIRLRWMVNRGDDGSPLETVYAQSHQDNPDDGPAQSGVIVVDSSATLRDSRDSRWRAKRTGSPVSFEGQVCRDPESWKGLQERIQELGWKGHGSPDGAWMAQRNHQGEICELTWGTLVWIQPENGDLGPAGAGGMLLYPSTESPRLPSLTLGRLIQQLNMSPHPWSHHSGVLSLENLDPNRGCLVILSSIRGLVPVRTWLNAQGTACLWQSLFPFPAWLVQLRQRLWSEPWGLRNWPETGDQIGA